MMILVLPVALIWPEPNLPLNDDWVYLQQLQRLVVHGEIDRHPYYAPLLLGQLFWSWIFCQFGISWPQISIWILALVSGWGLFAFSRQVGCSNRQSLWLLLLLSGNPLLQNLALSYMTDIPFMASSILAVIAFAGWLKYHRIWIYIAFTMISSLAFWIRQPGILLFFLPLSIWLFGKKLDMPRSMNTTIIVPLVLTACHIALAAVYAGFVVAGPAKGSQWLGAICPDPICYLKQTVLQLSLGWAMLGLFLLPFVPVLMSSFGWREWLVGLIFTIPLCLGYAGIGLVFPYRDNVLKNGGIGPDLLRDVFWLDLSNVPQWADSWGYLGLFLGLLVLAVICVLLVRTWRRGELTSFSRSLLALSGLFFMLSTQISFFDRYILPVFGLISILLMWQYRPMVRPSHWILPILFTGYGILGNREYLAWNRAKAAAFQQLQEWEIPMDRMDAGYEYQGMYNYDNPSGLPLDSVGWWVNDPEYVISFGPIPGYRELKAFPYYRYLWMKEDSIRILFKGDLDQEEWYDSR